MDDLRQLLCLHEVQSSPVGDTVNPASSYNVLLMFTAVYEIGCQLLLITNRKSHAGFRLIPISMTLDNTERRNSPYFTFFHRTRLLCRPITSQWLKIDL